MRFAFPECLARSSLLQTLDADQKQPFAWLPDTNSRVVSVGRWPDLETERHHFVMDLRRPLEERRFDPELALGKLPQWLCLHHRVLLAVVLTATLFLVFLLQVSRYLMTLCHDVSPCRV
jgi:hypothetical protein